jgi:apolipoprotein N-acyltransferase
MQDAISSATGPSEESPEQLSGCASGVSGSTGVKAGAITNWGLTVLCPLLLVLSFPDFNLSLLAWVGLVPLLVVIASQPTRRRSFLCGWLAGTAFFYGTCYWLTYSMVHFGGISTWLAYALLVPGALVVGFFPATFALVLAQLIRRWGLHALFAAPLLWVTVEWARLSVTGQLWNAIGYSQAFQPSLIQAARWGGVYAVGFLVVTVNAAIAFALLKRTAKTTALAALVVVSTVTVIFAFKATARSNTSTSSSNQPVAAVIALQPNVPLQPVNSPSEMQQLINRHLSMSAAALNELKNHDVLRLVVWPESPMNFAYAGDAEFRDLVTRFTRQHHTALIFNSLEPAPENGFYNSALMVNEAGRPIAQYDKIRLMPFGEYVPLPHWLPGSSAVRAIVGDFTPGRNYTLMPLGSQRAGVFICIESAYPWIARALTDQGADVLINISNDGYLGPTAVMRQHLANVIFRAVENGRPLLRVTNTGISAYVAPSGEVSDATQSFQPAVRTWTITRAATEKTFYTRHGDLFAGACAVLSLLTSGLSFATANGRGAIRSA